MCILLSAPFMYLWVCRPSVFHEALKLKTLVVHAPEPPTVHAPEPPTARSSGECNGKQAGTLHSGS